MNTYRPFLAFMELYDRAMAPSVTPGERRVLLDGALAHLSVSVQPPGVMEVAQRLVKEATNPPEKLIAQKKKRAAPARP